MVDIPNDPMFTSGNEVPDLDDPEMMKTPSGVMDEEDQMLAKKVLQRVEDEMYPEQAKYHEEWDDALKAYDADITPIPNRPNVRIPWSHTVIDTAMAEEIDAFPDIEIEAQEEDDRAKEPILNAAMKYSLSLMNWESVKIDARRICRIYGICPVRLSYVRETRKIKERVPVKGDNGWMFTYEEKFDFPYDDLKMTVIDNPRRFFLDDNARDIGEASDCALMTDTSWSKFKLSVQHSKYYKNLDMVKPGQTMSVDITGAASTLGQVSEVDDDKVRILEYWNRDEDQYVVMANEVVIRNTPLPDDHKELPFAVLHLYKRPHTFYSKGIPKILESIESTYNKLINAEIQATGLSFPILLTADDAGVDPRAIAPYPGIVLEGALGKVELSKMGAVPEEVYQLKNSLESLIVWVTGVNYQNLFSPSAESQRVGIESLKKESMLARVNANLRENESSFVYRIGDMLIQDIMQYYQAPKIRALMSDEDVKSIPVAEQVIDEDGKVRGVLEMRKIPIPAGVEYKESFNKEDGLFSLSKTKSDKDSFILARPEYIRAKGKMDIRPVRPSAMGSSKETKKLILAELLNTGIDVNAASMQMNAQTGPDGQQVPGKPVADIRYLFKTLVEAHELPANKALLSGDDEMSAAGEMEDMMSKITDSFNEPPLQFQQQQQPSPLQQVPPEQQGNMASQIF